MTLDALEGEGCQTCAPPIDFVMYACLALSDQSWRCSLRRCALPSCADLSSDLAECAIERFAEANFSRINNKSGFLMVRCALFACHLRAPVVGCLTVVSDVSWPRRAARVLMHDVCDAMRRASSAA